MAKYIRQREHPAITEYIMRIVDDSYNFLNSEPCKERFKSRAPAQYWRHVKIFTRRGSGSSTAALNLIDKFPQSLIITHSITAVQCLRDMVLNRNLIFSNNLQSDIFHNVSDYIVPHEYVDYRWFHNQKHYRLIILDSASMIEAARNNGYRGAIPGMDEFRERLFLVCDLLVELG